MQTYRQESYDAKHNAQSNLRGRTNYADDETLRFFHARILSSGCAHSGLIFWLVESIALDMHNTKRGFRYVLFDIAGNVIGRLKTEYAFKTSAAARKAMWEELNGLDAFAITASAIDDKEHAYGRDIERMREKLAEIKAQKEIAA